MTEKKLGEKTVDEFLEEIERDLKRLDEKLDETGKKFKKDVRGFEDKFNAFIKDPDIELGELKEKTGHELDRLKKELEFTATALKNSFGHFRDQYKDRKND